MTIRTIQTATGASPDAIRSVWKGLGLQDWPNRDFDRVLPRHTVTTLLTQMSKPATKRTPQAVAAAQKLLAEFQAGQHQNGLHHKPETWQPVIDTTAIRESTPEPRKRTAKPTAANQPEPEQQKKEWAFTRWIKAVTMLDMVYLATILTAVYGLWFCLQEMGAAFAIPYCLISWHALRMAKNPASKRTAQAGIAAVVVLEILTFFIHLVLFNLRLVQAAKANILPFEYSFWGAMEAPFYIACILAGLFSGAGIYAVSVTFSLTMEKHAAKVDEKHAQEMKEAKFVELRNALEDSAGQWMVLSGRNSFDPEFAGTLAEKYMAVLNGIK